MPRPLATAVVLVCATAFAAAQDAREAPASGEVRGRVVDARTGTPVVAAAVSLYGVGAAGRHFASTDADGRFHITGVPAGRYRMTTTKTGFLPGLFGQRDPRGQGRPFDVQPSQTFAADIALVRGGVIAGRIVDEFGDPIARLQVQAQRMRYSIDGVPRAATAGVGAITDDLGQFRLYELMPGDYYVVASSATTNAPVPVSFAPEGASDGYPPTFYPGTLNFSDAEPVPLPAGRDMFVQFTVTPARLARIRGTAVGPDGRPAAGAMVSLEAGSSAATMSGRGAGTIAADGTFLIQGVAPGDYTVRVRDPLGAGPGAAAVGAARVVVGSADVNGVTVVMVPGVTITGRLVFEGTSPRPRPSATVSARPAQSGAGEIEASGRMGPIKEDWSFEITNVHGRVYLSPTLDPPERDGWIVKSVLFNGEETVDRGLDVSGRTAVRGVEIVLTDRVASIAGRVSRRDGGPTDDATVVLLRDTGAGLPFLDRVRSVEVAANGRFTVAGLRAGTYYVTAVDVYEADDLFSPVFERRARQHATTVVVGEGETATVDVTVAPGQ